MCCGAVPRVLSAALLVLCAVLWCRCGALTPPGLQSTAPVTIARTVDLGPLEPCRVRVGERYAYKREKR